jgi:carbon monoxide dehydrogenase subunit G
MLLPLKFLNGNKMRRVPVFFIFLITIFIIFGLISLLLPSRVTLAKSIEINASSEKISDQILNFAQWKNWYPAFKDDSITVIKNPPANNILNSVTLKDKQEKKINLVLVDSNQTNIIVQVQTSSSTKVNYRFVLIPKTNNQTLLTWNIDTDLGWYPWKKMQGIFLDKFSGDQYEAALKDLKKAVEK